MSPQKIYWYFEQLFYIGGKMTLTFPAAAERYEAFRARVRGVRGSRVASCSESQFPLTETRQSIELDLQAQWFGGEFGKVFTGTDGEKIEIIQFGHWNRGAGPDFTESAVRIDGELRRGSIEIDLDVRSWESHGHGANRNFNDVVLHVFKDRPALNRYFTCSEDHRNIPQLLLPQFTGLEGPPDFLPEARPGRCIAPLAKMDDEEVEALLESAAQYRLRLKSRRLSVMMHSTHPDQAMFQAIAEALGFRMNKTAMAILSQRCPVKELLKMSPPDREARLFGAAGFLEHSACEKIGEDDSKTYLRELWDRWWKMRDDVQSDPSRAIPWCFHGSRPLNHPQRRVAALAAIVHDWEQLRKIWVQNVNNFEKGVNNSLNKSPDSFWNHHYTLSSTVTESSMKLIGKDRQRDILGNVILPGIAGLGDNRHEAVWASYTAMRGAAVNQKLRRAGLRLFGAEKDRKKLFTSYYHQQQGLLQIYRDFCLEDASNCENCPFPEQLSQWSTRQI